MKQQLIVRAQGNNVEFSAEAIALKNTAWELAAAVTEVRNAEHQSIAVSAQVGLATLLKQVEEARKKAKAPLIELGRKIDNVSKAFVKDLEEEELRLARLVGDYQALELAKTRAAEAARNRELTELERQRAEELAKASSHEEIDAIQEQYNQAAADLPGPAAPQREAGQVVTQDWEITVQDIWLLARAHPACVKIEPRLSAIKELLKLGVKVSGVNATPIVKASVRTRQHQVIEV